MSFNLLATVVSRGEAAAAAADGLALGSTAGAGGAAVLADPERPEEIKAAIDALANDQALRARCVELLKPYCDEHAFCDSIIENTALGQALNTAWAEHCAGLERASGITAVASNQINAAPPVA